MVEGQGLSMVRGSSATIYWNAASQHHGENMLMSRYIMIALFVLPLHRDYITRLCLHREQSACAYNKAKGDVGYILTLTNWLIS